MKRIISLAALLVLLIGLASTSASAAQATAALDLNSAAARWIRPHMAASV